jgi:hypothetical protein
MTFQQLTNHNFGSARWMAVGVSHKFNGLSSVTTNVQLQHTTGPVDVEVKVTGWQGLSMAQSMSLSYDSIALVDLSQNLKVGMVARGSLGTLGALNPRRIRWPGRWRASSCSATAPRSRRRRATPSASGKRMIPRSTAFTPISI